ncbi:putative heptosyltransferase family protein [Magnetospirillum sp. LM-5]|uniref:glycosyltransferase family 9 protein n=1 Tax=Magnetospirillum sp. LM-5 TaxID=2681466 RepID=UPI00138043BE|nr:glycosyltransferase family 9 protein [Magnetospirillum sp. LM-5]CAA7621257.1 putative heptosyltransferase family protein [Magnetospirillum sp. LM-5]
MSAGPATILVYVGLDAVGDGLMKLPFLRALKAAFPQARITWMAGKGHSVYAGILAPLVEGLVSEVLDQAGIGSRVGELFGRRPLAGRTFDLIIDTQRRLLTSLILRRIGHERFISAAAGFLLSDARPPAGYRRPASMVAQVMDLVELASGQPADACAPLPNDAAIAATAVALLPDGASYVGLAPGAGGRIKCWPLDRFIAVARRQAELGRVPVFLLGPAEADWAGAIREQVPNARFPLQQAAAVTPMLTIALGRRMGAAIANDSGTGHMLALADIPLVSLFGPTPADKFAPAARTLTVLRAADWGSDKMDAIPETAVLAALDKCLL